MPHYIGEWQLIPELCFYQEGEIPLSGLYTISQSKGVVSINVVYSTSEVENAELEYGGPVDGSKIALDQGPVTHASFEQIGDQELDSRAFIEEQEIAFARRLVSLDKNLMATWEIRHKPDGCSIINTQVYKRV